MKYLILDSWVVAIARLGLLVIALCLLTACINNSYYEPQVKQFTLHEDLSINTKQARVYLQEGRRTIGPYGENKYAPLCTLESKQLSSIDQPVVIESDVFQVIKIIKTYPDGMGHANARSHFNDGPIMFETQFYLHSDKQQHVLRMNCKIWSTDFFQRHLTVEQIKSTLGNIVTLE